MAKMSIFLVQESLESLFAAAGLGEDSFHRPFKRVQTRHPSSSGCSAFEVRSAEPSHSLACHGSYQCLHSVHGGIHGVIWTVLEDEHAMYIKCDQCSLSPP